jgi:hypothetical protein
LLIGRTGAENDDGTEVEDARSPPSTPPAIAPGRVREAYREESRVCPGEVA